jgi:sugar phosphate isomerase/epimerase
MRSFSLAYLTVNDSTVLESLDIAADLGYAQVGLRLRPNTPGAPHQAYIDEAAIQREVLARMRDLPVGVFDIEIIRIGANFQAQDYRALLEAGAALGAKAVLVAADDDRLDRLAENYARLCEFVMPYGMSADLEFMSWTGVKDALAALKVLELAGCPSNAGILFDALHFGRSTSQLSDLKYISPQWLHYAQMCDAKAGLHFSTDELIHTAREDRWLPGEGDIDLQGLFRALPANIPVSVELPNFTRSKAIGDRAWAKAALDATRKVLDEIDQKR